MELFRMEVPEGYEQWKRQYLKIKEKQEKEQKRRDEDAKEKMRGYLV